MMRAGEYQSIGIILTVALIALGLYAIRPTSESRRTAPTAVAVPSNALELQVLDVNPVIARNFQSQSLDGVLLSDDPRGTARRVCKLKRGDILLRYNRIEIQSAEHLRQMMLQSRIGDTIEFTVVRDGREFTASTNIPQTSAVDLSLLARADIAVVLVILIAIFAALFTDWIHRTVCVTFGAIAMIMAGTWFGFYDETKAFNAIQLSPIFILVGMNIFSIVLERLRFLEYIAKTSIVKAHADDWSVLCVLCGVTYLLSLIVNNLSAVLVMVPIALSVTRQLRINPVPVLSAQIIASNIGGASTMIGDFPNMIVASSTGLSFQSFLVFMAPVCFLLLLSLYWYYQHFDCLPGLRQRSPVLAEQILDRVSRDVSDLESAMDWPAVKRTLWLLGCTIAAFVFFPLFRIQAATIALAGGFLLLALDDEKAGEVLRRIGITDIFFFLSLFVIVGGAVHSGLLSYLSDGIRAMSFGNRIWYCILLMWCAGLVTPLLNAGPAAVFFIPLVMSAQPAAMGDLVWWALSLGILAGSSATLTGATAGIVTQTLLEQGRTDFSTDAEGHHLTFKNYSRIGVPVAFMFLCLSSIYLVVLGSLVE